MDTQAEADRLYAKYQPLLSRPGLRVSTFIADVLTPQEPTAQELAEVTRHVERHLRDDAPPAASGKARARALIHRY